MWHAAALRTARGPLAAALLFAVITCTGPTAPNQSFANDGEVVTQDPSVPASARVGAVLVNLDSARLAPGHATQARVTVLGVGGDTIVRASRRASWSSTNPQVASVNPVTGSVLALTAGSTNIVATVSGVMGRASLSVAVPAPAAVFAVSVALASAQITLAQTTQASAVARDSAGSILTGRAIAWSSSDTSVAVIDRSGTVTPRAIGLVQIVASVDGVSGRATLSVTALPPAPVAAVAVSLGKSSIIVGETTTAAAVARDSSGALLTGRQVTWSSKDTLVATMDPVTGVVTSHAIGSASIVATVDGVSGQAGLTVSAAPAPRVASVTVSLNRSSIIVGDTAQAIAVARDSAGAVLTGRVVFWSSSSATVATVDGSTGKITGRGVGTAQIAALVDGTVGSAAITVQGPPPPRVASVSVTLSDSSLVIGQTTTARVTARDSTGSPLSGRAAAWSTDSTRVATVDSSGLVTARGAGGADVIATVEGVVGDVAMTVAPPPPVPVATVSVTLSRTSIVAGDTTSAVAVARDANGNVLTGRALTWSVQSATVATLDSRGVVTGRAPGNTTVTATVDGVTGASTIQVSALLAFASPLASAAAGTGFGASVVVRNTQGSTIPDYSGPVTIAIRQGTGAPGAQLSGTTTVTAASGIATFTGLSIDSAATGYVLVASAAGLSPATSNAFDVSAGAARVLLFTTQPPTTTAGAPFSVAVTARDAFGNRATGFTGGVSVAIGTNAGGGSLAGTTTVAAAAGVATFTGLTISSAGSGYTLTANSAGVSGATSLPFTITSASTNSDEPTDPGLGYLWADNFDRYLSSAAMLSSGNCPSGTEAFGLPSAHITYGQRTQPNSNDGCNSTNSTGYSLITGRNGLGHAIRSSVKADPTHAQQGISWLSPWDPNFAAYSGTIVIQFYFRASPGGTPGSYGTKWIEMWFTGNTTSRRVQWGLDGGTDARPKWSMVLGANPGGTVNRTTQPVGPWWDQVNDGNWHRFTALFRGNTSSTYSHTGGTTSGSETYTGTSSRDGRIAAWIDGTKIMDYSQATVGVTPAGGLNPWCYQGDVDMIPVATGAYLLWPGVFNGSPVAWTLDHDDLKVWTIR